MLNEECSSLATSNKTKIAFDEGVTLNFTTSNDVYEQRTK